LQAELSVTRLPVNPQLLGSSADIADPKMSAVGCDAWNLEFASPYLWTTCLWSKRRPSGFEEILSFTKEEATRQPGPLRGLEAHRLSSINLAPPFGAWRQVTSPEAYSMPAADLLHPVHYLFEAMDLPRNEQSSRNPEPL